MNLKNTFSFGFRPSSFSVLLAITFLSFTAGGLNAQNVTVNPGAGSYPTLKDAFDAINAGTHTGAVFINIVGNTTETLSAVLNASGTGAASYSSITMSPNGGAARTISGAIAGMLVDLNGADNVLIDGLNTGGNSLTISNTSVGAANTIRFINDASNNTITNCRLEGSATTLQNGVVFFSTGTATGNDFNNINNCEITGAGGNLPINGVFSLGTSAAIDNSNNTLNANKIFDFFNAASTSIGVHLNATNTANSNWTITNNKLYQTATRLYTTANTHQGIFVGSGSAYTISGNTIGFADANGTGTYNMVGNSVALAGFPGSYVTSGTANATRFIAISGAFTAGGTVSEIQGNTIAGFALFTSSGATTTNGILCGINVTSGNANIGTTTGNTIGSTTGNSSIYTACTTSGGAVVGIFASSVNTVVIQNNTVGAINSMGTTATISGGITGINTAGTLGAHTITGNTIGNSTNPNLRMGNLTEAGMLSNTGSTFGVATGLATFNGILNAATGTQIIGTVAAPNIVQNASLNSSSASAAFRGISNTSGLYSVTGNTVRNITSASTNITTATAGLAGVGILHTSSTTGGTSVITQNTIHNLELSNTTTSGTNVAGVAIANTVVDVTRNKIWDLKNASTSTTVTTPGSASGVFIRSGTTAGSQNVINNMITLGTGQTTNTAFIGIWSNHGSSPNPNVFVYFNSIRIEGTATSGAIPSFGYHRGNFAITPINLVNVDIRNNVLDNARTGGTGKHYAIGNLFNATGSATGWGANASNYNILNSADPNTVGFWTADRTFADWKVVSASDANSISAAPLTYVNTAVGDLHILFPPASPVESAGQDIPAVTLDFDGQTRSTLSPVDIGADAGNFSDAPSISVTPLANTCLAGARMLTATITDPDGVPTMGIGLPVLYWRINGGAYMAATATFGGGSTYTFSFGAGAVSGDAVFYYIAAQDNLLNVGTSPLFGAAGFTANPPAASTPPTTPHSYLVVPTLSGTYTVGVGGNYPTLTAAVAAYNVSCLGGPVVFSLIDGTYPSETFPISINANPEASAVNTLTIKPTGVTSITGSSTTAMILLNGADYVTINGSSSNTANTVCPAVSATRDLTITNTSATTTSAVIWLGTTGGGNAVTNCAVLNCILIGNAPTTTIVGLGSGGPTIGTGGTANNNISFINNDVRACQFGIYSAGASAANKNQNLTVNQNLINTVAPNNVGLTGIYSAFTNNITVSGNTVSGMNNTASSDVVGINLGMGATSGIATTTTGIADGVSNVTITNNTVGSVTQSGTFAAAGIALGNTISGTALIANNMVYGVACNGTSTDFGGGLVLGGGTAQVNVYHNTVVMQGVVPGTTGASSISTCLGVTTATDPPLNIRNNIFTNIQAGNAGATFRIAAIALGYATFTNLVSNYNDLFSGGAGPGTYTTGVTGGLIGTNRITLADWQAATGKDLNSLNFAPVFVSATDNHLVAGDPINAPLLCGGTAVPVTNDFDCQTRSTTTPTIGADNIPNNINAAVAITETSGTTNNDGTICSGASATLTASGGGTYAWSTGETTAAISVTPGSTTTYTVTVTVGACSTSIATTITVNSASASIAVTETSGTSDDGTICAGATATLTASGGGTYAWSTGATTAVINVTPAGTTTYTVTVTLNGCTASTSTIITVDPGPTVTISVAETSGTMNNDGSICIGASATLTATGGGTYSWNTGETTAGISVTPTMTTTYTVTVTSATGCTASNTRTITVNPLPTASITVTETSGTTNNDGIICAGATATLTGNGGTSYAWSTGASTTAIMVSPAATTTYTVTVTNANGCTATATTTITVNPAVTYTQVIINPTSCSANNGAIILTMTGGNGPFVFNWTTTNGCNVASGDQNQDTLCAGNYFVTITSADGCSVTGSFFLDGPAPGCFSCPTITQLAATPNPVCASQNVTLDATGLAGMGVTYGIEFKYFLAPTATPYTGGTSIATIPNGGLGGGGTTATTNFSLATANTYYVYAILSPAPFDPSCRPSATTTLVVNALPVAATSVAETSGIANNDGIICAGASATITASGGGTYAWSTGASTAAITVTPAGTTTYTVTVTSAAGCTATASRTITVNPLPTPTISVSETSGIEPNDGVICAGASAILTASGGGTYTWSTGATTATITVSPAATQSYTVTVTNSFGCTATASSTITVNPLPAGSIAVTESSGLGNNDGIICAGATATLTASGGTSYGWSTGETTAAINVTPANTTTYTVTITNANNCSVIVTSTITVNPQPAVAIAVTDNSGTTNNDGIICAGASATLTASGGTTYAWSTGATTAAIIVTPAITTTYTVTVTNTGNCSGTATRTITVNPSPTTFNMTGGGQVCTTDITGVLVGLSGSQIGVNYQLFLNGNASGAPVAGTGAAISFGTQLVGTYTVVATNTTTGCTATMTGTIAVTSFNCTVAITDPCVCKNNATNLTNGQFDETIKVGAPGTQTWTVVNATGLYRTTSLAPPNNPIPIVNGFTLTNLGAAMNMHELKGIHVDALGYSVTVSNNQGTILSIGNTCAYPNPSITSDFSPLFCLFSPPFNLEGNPGDANIVSQSFTINGVPATQFNPSQLGVGNHTIVYTVNGGVPKAFGPNDPGCIQSVSTVAHVIATPAVLNCNDLVNISIPISCTGEVKPDDVLEGAYGCFDDYIVELDRTLPYGDGPWTSAVLTTADIGKTYQYRVTHLVSGNKCWGSVKIEDKLAPELSCQDIHLICPITNYTPGYLLGTLGIAAAYPTITDCSNYTSSYTDSWVDLACTGTINGQNNISAYVLRKWTATDVWGNSTTCNQYIYFDRRHVSDVEFPADYTIQCSGNINTDPSVTGAPYVVAFNRQWPIYPNGGFCEMQAAYSDQILPVCDGTYKILRTWTVLDWCLPTSPFPPYNPLYYIQLIKVTDETGPALVCPANTTVTIDPFQCCATVDMPDMVIKDACSRINNIGGMVTTFDQYTGQQTGMHVFGGSLTDFPGNNWWTPDTMARWGTTPCLPIGSHTVRYFAQDDCSNSSFCTFRLTVADYVPPVAACDQETVVGIGVDDIFDCYEPTDDCDGAGVTYVKASTFNDGSFDDCHNVKLTVRRMAPYSDCITSLSSNPCYPNGDSEQSRATAESDSIKFYCCEVGTTQTVILRVYQVDINGNIMNGPDGSPLYNECMIQVTVQDKVKPICQAPAHVTVSCEQFDPSLWVYGKADVFDNCCLDTTKVYQGQCGLTHSVSYTQFDTLCSKGTIVRTFRAFDCHGQSSQCTQRIVVNYEQDYFVRFPNDVIVTMCDGTGNYGEPTFFGKDCELLGVSYEDEIFTVVPDACFKIERNWKIINWCTYNPNAGCIDVPNPNPNAISNHPSNLPGPIVSPIQTTGDPWKSTIVKINPTDPLATNFSIYYNANANCYTYKQVIKIIDNQAPTSECPASPVTVCDVTPNDPQLWNAMYWWDNSNQSHDLCEAPSDICLTATDACSGANINIEYLLFLDLDGDGIMETVVNSTQLGNQSGGLGWNNVMFGNATGAGTSRQFDFRPVAGNQKWGFAIQETVTGNKKTACVKFNTFQAQATYVTPQLPHGTHKIKWIVSDGCGNESVCEYTIIVKDCKAPTVVCLNGLSVNIMPTGMITLWATDFLQYAEDNCTLNPYLKYGIRKCGTGTGFPVDGNGNPITNVTFDCTELGTQCVELWAIDLAGNADYCETYVIVQDNAGNCGNTGTVSVSGAMKTEPAGGAEGIAEVMVNGQLSNNSGQYMVNNILPGTDVTITPVKDDNPLNGVTTYDLVLISKHILGIEPLGTPYKMIAADANKSNSITTFDIVEIRKLILGIYQELPANTSWRFVDKAYSFPNPLNPFQTAFPEIKSISNIQNSMMDQDFVGVKIGDVNNTVVANSLMVSDDRTAGTLLFDLNDRDVEAGEAFEVTFKAAEKTQGFQMTLNLNGLEVAGLEESEQVNATNFGVHTDALTVSIDNAFPSSGGGQGEDAFTVTFRAAKAGKLSEMLTVSSRITKAEGYSLADGRMDVALRFDGKTIAGVGFELYQNQPNPFVDKTFVGFNLPEAATATLSVYDEMGRLVFTQKGNFAKGYNAISLDRALLNTTGVLYYTLETATDSATKKMIQAK